MKYCKSKAPLPCVRPPLKHCVKLSSCVNVGSFTICQLWKNTIFCTIIIIAIVRHLKCCWSHSCVQNVAFLQEVCVYFIAGWLDRPHMIHLIVVFPESQTPSLPSWQIMIMTSPVEILGPLQPIPCNAAPCARTVLLFWKDAHARSWKCQPPRLANMVMPR